MRARIGDVVKCLEMGGLRGVSKGAMGIFLVDGFV